MPMQIFDLPERKTRESVVRARHLAVGCPRLKQHIEISARERTSRAGADHPHTRNQNLLAGCGWIQSFRFNRPTKIFVAVANLEARRCIKPFAHAHQQSRELLARLAILRRIGCRVHSRHGSVLQLNADLESTTQTASPKFLGTNSYVAVLTAAFQRARDICWILSTIQLAPNNARFPSIL